MFSKNKLYAIAYKKIFQDVNDLEVFNKIVYAKHFDADIKSIETQLLQALEGYVQVVYLYRKDDLC